MYVSVAQQWVMQEGDLSSNRGLGVAGSCGPSGLQAPYGSVGWVQGEGQGPELKTTCCDLPCTPLYPTPVCGLKITVTGLHGLKTPL